MANDVIEGSSVFNCFLTCVEGGGRGESGSTFAFAFISSLLGTYNSF